MRTGTPDLLPLFRSEFQVRLLGLLVLQPDRAWTIPELAERFGAPISSVHRELGRAERADIIERNTGSRPHTFRAAEGSPLYQPLADLLRLTLGVEEEPSPAPEEIAESQPLWGPLGDLVSRFVPSLHPRICQRVVEEISPRRRVIGLLRLARRLTGA